jgi:hypothetical protein
MAQTMRKVKGKKVRETGHKSHQHERECGTKPPSQASLDADMDRLTAFLRGETRVMLDEEVPSE